MILLQREHRREHSSVQIRERCKLTETLKNHEVLPTMIAQSNQWIRREVPTKHPVFDHLEKIQLSHNSQHKSLKKSEINY